VVWRPSLVEAHHHGSSLVAGRVMILTCTKRDRQRRERHQHAQYGNKSHLTCYGPYGLESFLGQGLSRGWNLAFETRPNRM
jgi:hypothetical protein